MFHDVLSGKFVGRGGKRHDGYFGKMFAEITITTRFEAANAGEVCATAIAITAADTIDIDYKFGVEKWYKITADKSGFYTINAKLGYAANMKTKVGDCDM